MCFGYDAIASVISKSIKKGLEFYNPQRPTNFSRVDEHSDITAMSPQQIGQLHQYFVNMHSYMLVELAKSDMDMIAAENAHDAAKKTFIVGHKTGQTKWELDADLAADHDLRHSRMRVLEKQALREMLSALTKGIDNKANLFSREITRRAAEKDSK